jgi:predicted metal-dependent hydrolase
MAVKKLEIAELGSVAFYKRRGARSIRLTITPAGTVRVSLPQWTPYKVAIDFVRDRQDWILTHRPQEGLALQTQDRIGKAHKLIFIPSSSSRRPTARIAGNEIRVTHPSRLAGHDDGLQTAAARGCTKALKLQAEQLLPMRVAQLAANHGFEYQDVTIRQLKSRWGSCDSNRRLTFNLYLMQLPWELIDYVILHELQHTKIMRHGPPFWTAMQACSPSVSQHRKSIRQYRPVLLPERAA